MRRPHPSRKGRTQAEAVEIAGSRGSPIGTRMTADFAETLIYSFWVTSGNRVNAPVDSYQSSLLAAMARGLKLVGSAQGG